MINWRKTISNSFKKEKSLDHGDFLSHARRMVQSGSVVGGAVARATWRKFSPQAFQSGSMQQDAEKLKQALGNLRGPLVKVAQLMASIPGLLPDDYIAELSELQTNAPSMGWGFVQRRMRGELGADWTKYFQSFEKNACHAASLGQVHFAVLANGAKAACKLQYPGMEKSIEADLAQLKTIFGLYSFFDGAINQEKVYQELVVRLKEELNYRQEAANLLLFRHALKDCPEISVPVPARALTTERLLVMQWLEGESFSDFLAGKPSLEARNQVARTLFKAWYRPFYRYGILHGDPHSGNYAIRQDNGINLLDLGSIRVFPVRFVQGVVALYKAVLEKSEEKIRNAYALWGFEGINQDIFEALNLWSSFFFRPFLRDGAHTLEETNNSEQAHQVLENVYATLKKGGGVTLPREFVLLDRSALGLGGAFLRLGASLDWKKLFLEEVAQFSEMDFEKLQHGALEAAGLSIEGDSVLLKNKSS